MVAAETLRELSRDPKLEERIFLLLLIGEKPP
jgi:hypothetical protein